jgi:hypothetical protein
MINPPLSKQQEFFVEAILNQELMRAYGILKDDHSPGGAPLGAKGRREMTRYIDELRDVLLSFGSTTPQLDDLARQFGPGPSNLLLKR